MQSLLSSAKPSDIYVLVRDAAKARRLHGDDINILESAYDDPAALEAAFASLPSDKGFRLFLACSNGPDQEKLESAILRAAACKKGSGAGCSAVVKLSSATPVLEAESGGPHAAHAAVEQLLADAEAELGRPLPHAVLRPNLFLDEVCTGRFLGVAPALRAAAATSSSDTDACIHPFAEASISAVDVDDVADCAAAILLEEAERPRWVSPRGKYFDLTGPRPVVLARDLAAAASSVRPRPVAIEACSVEAYLAAKGLPPSSAVAGFFEVLRTRCGGTSGAVEELTGRPARSLEDYFFAKSGDTRQGAWRREQQQQQQQGRGVEGHGLSVAAAFMPNTFSRLVAFGEETKEDSKKEGGGGGGEEKEGEEKDASLFGAAARVMEVRSSDEVAALGPNEALIKVDVAGVNGGADTFDVVNAPSPVRKAEAAPPTDDGGGRELLPLGHEGVGVVVAVGAEAPASLAPGALDT